MAAIFKLAILISCVLLWAAAVCQGALEVSYYNKTCPRAEAIVSAEVRKAVRANAGVGAGLIRLLFHDCFVQGCDASILLDPTTANPQPEKLGLPNRRSLRGFEVIDAAKDAVEEACPGTVSCADIVAFAARDASYILSGRKIDFKMPAGRLDGRYSNGTETLDFLPAPFLDHSGLVKNFAKKGLDVEDMVVLSGAHSVGRAHCSSFVQDRLNTSSSDIDPSFARWLRRRCPDDLSDTNNPTVRQDTVTAAALDSQYYANVLRHRVLLTSDAALLTSPETARMVRDYAKGDGQWERKFETAMVRLASIDVKAGADGEIRKNCRFVNYNYNY
ncbi:peroxidase 2-like [Phragmites australis]|uniref:peroxidase 2-like n=1 Tax=Phragmites australis TaxID=29695 RepID=UPI002D782592|nr:peroxidase 2-like [Phragmites australis]